MPSTRLIAATWTRYSEQVLLAFVPSKWWSRYSVYAWLAGSFPAARITSSVGCRHALALGSHQSQALRLKHYSMPPGFPFHKLLVSCKQVQHLSRQRTQRTWFGEEQRLGRCHYEFSITWKDYHWLRTYRVPRGELSKVPDFTRFNRTGGLDFTDWNRCRAMVQVKHPFQKPIRLAWIYNW